MLPYRGYAPSHIAALAWMGLRHLPRRPGLGGRDGTAAVTARELCGHGRFTSRGPPLVARGESPARYAARPRTLPARRGAQSWCLWEPWSSPGGSSAPPPAPSSRGSSSAASSMPSWSVSGSFGSVPRATSSPSERPSPSVSGLSGSVPSFCSARSESPSPSRSTRGGRAAASGTKPTPHSRTDALSSPAAIVLVLLVFIPRLLSFEEFVHPLRVRAGGVLRDSFREPWLVDGEAGQDAGFLWRPSAQRLIPRTCAAGTLPRGGEATARCAGARSRQSLGSRGSFAAPLRSKQPRCQRDSPGIPCAGRRDAGKSPNALREITRHAGPWGGPVAPHGKNPIYTASPQAIVTTLGHYRWSLLGNYSAGCHQAGGFLLARDRDRRIGKLHDAQREEHVLPPRDAVGDAGGEVATQPVRDRVSARQGDDVRR